MEPGSTLVPFDHTYILYYPGDPFSLILAASSLLPILILIFLFSWFVITRELEPCLFALGHVCNDIISGIIKNLVKYPRPVRGQIFKKDGGLVWGMPSSHSQFMSFWCIYVILMYIYKWPYRKLTCLEKMVYIISTLIVVMIVVFSRIIFEYHNWNQVIVGLLLGSTLSSAYVTLVTILREYGIFDVFLQLKIFKKLEVKDGFGRGAFKTLHEEREEWEKLVKVAA